MEIPEQRVIKLRVIIAMKKQTWFLAWISSMGTIAGRGYAITAKIRLYADRFME